MSEKNATRQLTIYTLVALGIGWGGMAFMSALPGWWKSYQYSTSAEYKQTASGSEGPADYMIYHKDFDGLRAMAAADPEILSIDKGMLPGMGRVIFASHSSPAINTLRMHPDTGFLADGAVPIICH